MFDFSQIDDIKLSAGKHASPVEGVCFYEAVAFFAGEPHSDQPECACPVLTAYGIRLNDAMPDGVRNRLLLPLVPLVAGTRDKANELKRAEFLAMWAVNKVLSIIFRERGFEDRAAACEQAASLSEAKDAAYAAYAADAYAAYAADAANADAAYAYAANAYAADAANADAAAAAASAAASAAAYAANAYAAEQIWTTAADGLKQAILIGRHEGFCVPEPVLQERRQRLSALAC